MKKSIILTTALFYMSFILSGCEAIGTIFKAGMWSGIIIVVVIIFLIVFLIGRSKKK